jgi:hypothetical protein
MHRKLLLAAMLAASTPVSTSALAQIESREGIELQNQILELRQELQQLQQLQSQAAGEPAPPIGPPLQQGQGAAHPAAPVAAIPKSPPSSWCACPNWKNRFARYRAKSTN